MTTWGEYGPIKRPVIPAPISTAAIVDGVSPIIATSGIMSGAMIALAPASVPRRATTTIDVIIDAIIAFFSLSMPILFIRVIIRNSATPVSFNTAPRAEPSMMMNPIMPRNEPMESASTPPMAENGCFVMIALNTTQITTFSTGLISLNASMI